MPTRSRGRLLPLWLALTLVVALMPSIGTPSVRSSVNTATEIRPRVTGITPLDHEVYAYLPYWRLDSGTVDRLQYDLVSTIAFFGVPIKADGNLDTAWVGYQEYVGEDAAAVTNAAHDRGVRVVPTFQLFDSGSLTKMLAFLGSATAQNQFIGQALDLMAARQADGANLDFEPVYNEQAAAYLAFVKRFRTAMQARFPTAQLVNSTSAGAGKDLLVGLPGLVDRVMLMTYNYRWSGSTVTGAVAPLDHASRNVRLHITRALQWVPAKQLLMGVPYYGYDWPVKSDVPNAAVQSNKTLYGAVTSVTYAQARTFLEMHPDVEWRYDALEGSGFYTYWDSVKGTFRQVYFEEQRSLDAKYDYAIVTGLAGIGIWTIDNDRGYPELWDLLRAKFYAPVYQVSVGGYVTNISKSSAGAVFVTVHFNGRNVGTVPIAGSWRWTLRDGHDRIVKSGSRAAETIYPGTAVGHATRVSIGLASALPAGTYKLRARFISAYGTWTSGDVSFRQPY